MPIMLFENGSFTFTVQIGCVAKTTAVPAIDPAIIEFPVANGL